VAHPNAKVIEEPAEVVREYGPYPDASKVRGVTFDGEQVWFAAGDHLQSVDPATGEPKRKLDVRADAGTAFDGSHLYQIAGAEIHKIDPASGHILSSIPLPGEGPHAGLTWAEGSLYVAERSGACIHQIDPVTGDVRRVIPSTRYVTGVTWVDGELWQGHWENDQSELRRIDPESGEVLERLMMPEGAVVAGLESDGADLLFCGGASSNTVRVVRRPRRAGR
jgi:streptogramin lyase